MAWDTVVIVAVCVPFVAPLWYWGVYWTARAYTLGKITTLRRYASSLDAKYKEL